MRNRPTAQQSDSRDQVVVKGAKGMTHQTLRGRFHLSESKAASVSQVIAATIEANMNKADEKVGGSRKYARYLPFWA